MARISRDQLFMGFARLAAQRSTCFRMSVGAIIVLDRRPISIGYNGPPSGEEHCMGERCPLSSSGGCTRSDHAEKNALDGIPEAIDYSTALNLYITHSPCQLCAEYIGTDSRIKNIYYNAEYRDAEPLEFLMWSLPQMGIYRMTDSGYVIDRRTNQIVSNA